MIKVKPHTHVVFLLYYPYLPLLLYCLQIEAHHGTLLVARAFGYMVVTRNGITETELEDILSLDDEVLDDVFEYHIPPIRRIPSILWARIRYYSVAVLRALVFNYDIHSQHTICAI